MEVLKSDIDSLLSGDKQYVIPVFQRFYEWPKERLENLWEDILALIEDNPKAGSSHFIGPMVHMLDVKKTNRTSSVRRFIVVNGQQRLMSIFVLICAVRDHAIKSGYNPLAKSIEQKNYISLIDNYGKTFYKIQLYNIFKSFIFCRFFLLIASITAMTPIARIAIISVISVISVIAIIAPITIITSITSITAGIFSIFT